MSWLYYCDGCGCDFSVCTCEAEPEAEPCDVCGVCGPVCECEETVAIPVETMRELVEGRPA
jgi:hypothetical protein